MKAILTTAAAMALSVAFLAPALAQQAGEHAAVKNSGGQCAIRQAMLHAMADGEQQRMEETKLKIDLLIENALALSRSTKLAQLPVKPEKGSTGG